MNETLKTILNRRSTRAYSPEQLKEEELQSILEAGKYAPSAINEQPWHFTVVQNQELLNKINEACKMAFISSGHPMFAERAKEEGFSVFYKAPPLIIVSGQQNTVAPQIDCALAIQNMFLAAEAVGVGSCWIHAIAGIFQGEAGEALKKELHIPQTHTPYYSGSFGYKAMDPQAPERKENTVSILR